MPPTMRDADCWRVCQFARPYSFWCRSVAFSAFPMRFRPSQFVKRAVNGSAPRDCLPLPFDLGGIIRERTLQPRFELREVEPDFIRRQELVGCAGKAGDHHKVAFLDACTGSQLFGR